MSKFKSLFKKPQKAALAVVCLLVIVAAIGTALAYAAGAFDRSTAIGGDAAANFAFADAGIDPVSASALHTEFKREEGQFVYKVTFSVEDTEYEYLIGADSGAVIRKKTEIQSSSNNAGNRSVSKTLAEAQEIALADAEVAPRDAVFSEVNLDQDDGLWMYEFKFHTESTWYEYEINANTGAVYSKVIEAYPASAPEGSTLPEEATAPIHSPANSSQITLETAKEIALTDAGVSASAATFTKAKSDYEDGVLVYDIEFYTATHEYEYEITAGTGGIYSKSAEAFPTDPGNTATTPATNPGTPPAPPPAGASITLEAAKSAALSDAGVSASAVTFTKAKSDYEDGILVYDIEFYTDTHEYEYEIEAATGAVYSKSVEAFQTTAGTPGAGSEYISLDRAKSVALGHAGLASNQVTFTKAELDYDDGVAVYEIEFRYGSVEYEYEIDAVSGGVLEYDQDRD